MYTRTFALVFGIVLLVVGIAGFIPGLLVPSPQPAAIHAMDGRLFGLFPVNAFHSLVHAAFGVWGLIAYRSLNASLIYARVVAIAYAVLTVMGLFPVLNTVFGLMPIAGNDIWLHLLLAVIAAYFGFFAVTRESAIAADEPSRRRATVR